MAEENWVQHTEASEKQEQGQCMPGLGKPPFRARTQMKERRVKKLA